MPGRTPDDGYRLADIVVGAMSHDLASRTDSYFLKTYAVFLRRPVISAPRFAIEFLESMAAARGTKFDIELNYPEASWVGAGEPVMCTDLPKVAFLAMDARHCTGPDMAQLMAYAASVGSAHAKRVAGAVGF